jgi:predicted metalloprotease with PDZ domain
MIASLLLSTLLAAPVAAPRPILVEVDASEAPRRLFSAKLHIPAAPGPLTLVYPAWIPGEHGPTGPIADLSGLHFSAGGKEIAWRRDPVNMYAFKLDVPAGADAVDVALEYLSPTEGGVFTAGPAATQQLTVISWNTLVLSPAGKSSDELTYQASLRLPEGWKFGGALRTASTAAGRVEFAPVSFTTLVDAPLLAGAHLRTIELSEGPIAHRIHVAADSEAALAVPDAVIAGWKRLVAETGAHFGARHYRSYDFLLTLSDHTAHFGLEHHESSDNRIPERSLVDPETRLLSLDLLPHEMTHSWNGKYRRPAALMPASFEKPMEGELLWVYEGLTDYLGLVFAARSGLATPAEFRESLARVAAETASHGGRSWRPTADTGVAAQVLYGARPDWQGRRRGVDFYFEGVLLWLDADTLIRRSTNGAKSLDDFCRLFHGGESGAVKVVSYTLADVTATLGMVLPYDWAGFFKERAYTVQPQVNLAGIENAGYKLSFAEAVPPITKARESVDELVDARFSLGFIVKEKEGLIPDVLPNTPADKAGVGPGMKLVAVNGRRFSREVLRDALRETKTSKSIELLLDNGEFFRTFKIDYDGGDRHPNLTADPAKTDLLAQIIKPLTPEPPAAK